MGKDFGVPLGRVHRFFGKNLREPCRGAENLRWDMTVLWSVESRNVDIKITMVCPISCSQKILARRKCEANECEVNEIFLNYLFVQCAALSVDKASISGFESNEYEKDLLHFS